MILAATGHRPPKLGGYGVDVRLRLHRLATNTITRLRPDAVISGFAQGWDLAMAAAAIAVDVPLIAAIPFKGQELMWPDDSREVYHRLLAKAAVVEYVCAPGYAAWKMQRRNEWMVDLGTHLAVLWDGTDGGTANCVEYAKRRDIEIVDLWNDWLRLVYGAEAPRA